MAQPKPVSDAELLSLLDEEFTKGIAFANDPEKDERSRALDYYDGYMPDLPHEPGRSGIVSRTVSEQVDRQLPGLLRVFNGSEKVFLYQPMRPGDEAMAAQATDYVNYIWNGECNGFLVLATAIQDALQVRNGIIKVYWSTERDYETEHLTGLTDDELTMLLGNPEMGIPPSEEGLEVIGHTPTETFIPAGPAGPAQVLVTHDIVLRRVTTNGGLRVENVAPEEFGISARAKTIDDAAWVWHRVRTTRSDLIKQGYPQDVVDDIPAYGIHPEDYLRRGVGDRDHLSGEQGYGATEEVEIVECYGFADRDGDGIAESRKVIVTGSEGARKILLDEEWNDERPFVDLRPHIVPHRWQGRSVADQTMDLQRVQTALWRGLLDNAYEQIRPMYEVVQTNVINPDEVLNRTFGGVVRTKQAGSVNPLIVPNVIPNVMNAIASVDKTTERRTGVSDATPSLDETAIVQQTATASQLEHDAGYARTELVARIMAEMGLKPLARKMLKIIVANQDRPRTIRLRDEWVEMDPRSWDADMDVDINVGLGTGSRQRDLAMLGQVLNQQEMIIKQFGLNNPVVDVPKVVGTLHKMVEASGLRNPEQFFALPSPQDVQAYMASKPPPMDPRIAAVQARAQAEERRFQLQQQIAGAKLQLEEQSRARKVQTDAQADAVEAQADLEQMRAKLQLEAEMKRQELAQEFELRRQELELEAELKMREMAHGLHVSGMAQLVRPQ
jgi:hypothetical protein